jgi:hypothetical protein
MRARKVVAYGVLGLVGAVAAGAIVLYLLASAVPGEYRPATDLLRPERQAAGDRFFRLLQDFNNRAEDVRPFEITLRQEELNEYLASMDEIVEAFPEQPAGSAYKAMDGAGVSGLAVAIRPGALVLMARSTRHDKIVSLDVSPSFTGDGRLRLAMTAARVGTLPIPRALARRQLDRLKRQFRKRAAARRSNGPTAEQVGELLQAMVRAIDDRPILPVFGLREEKRVRLTRMDLEQGEMTLHFAAYERASTRPGDGR